MDTKLMCVVVLVIVVLVIVVLVQGCSQPWYASGSSGINCYNDAHGNQLTTRAIIETEATYPWTARSKWLCGAMVGLHYLDYETTRRLNFGEFINADGSGGHFDETNWLISGHPSDSEVAMLKGGVVLGTVLLTEILPEHRDVIFLISGLIGGVCAGGNLRLYELHK